MDKKKMTLIKEVLISLELHIAEQECCHEKELYLDRNCKAYSWQLSSDFPTLDILGWRKNRHEY